MFIGNLNLFLLSTLSLMLLSCCLSILTPTNDSIRPFIVPESDLMKANSAIQIGSVFSSIGTPILAGILLNQFGIISTLVLSFIVYLLAAFTRAFMQVPHVETEYTGRIVSNIISDIKESVQYMLKENRTLAHISIILFLYGLTGYALADVLSPILVQSYLLMNEVQVGISVGIINLGGIFDVVLLGLFKEKASVANLKGFLLLLNAIVILTGLAIVLFNHNMLIYVLITFGFFLAFSFGTVIYLITFTHIGVSTTPHLIGKVMGLVMAFIFVSMIASNYLFGWLLGNFTYNPGLTLMILPAIVFILTLFVGKIKTEE